CDNRARMLVMHPVNPPHLVPIVEIVPTPWTDPAIPVRARALMEEVGQSPVSLDREIPGFVLNRLQGALLDEAFALLAEGYASAEDIDRTVRDGLGLRWAFMGPFETIDLNAPKGLADYAERLGPMFSGFAEQRQAGRDWRPEAVARADAERREMLPETGLADRRNWRDAMLMAILRAKQQG
ncbi:3-hydroxyacyl-CoA dehydrogenase family protein, partial [uncultured Salipiger sp.]|uniref:3-hydroxyacyl-CoA dehydrogenase family protein n=1 Tax=uncultured Salipiger sp. TaxID=499810 RepID=UPI002596A2A3